VYTKSLRTGRNTYPNLSQFIPNLSQIYPKRDWDNVQNHDPGTAFARHLYISPQFLALLIYLWWQGQKTQHLTARKRWAITLFLAALWSSAILRFHGGQAFTAELIDGWGITSNYLLSLTALGLLLTTTSYLAIPRRSS
jgi:hypothetical protein